MKYLIIALAALSIVCCSKSNDVQVSSENTTQTFDLSTSKGLCLYVIAKAETATGQKAVPPIVTTAYKRSTCPEQTDAQLALWKCMKDQMDSGKGFYDADGYCSEQFQD